MIEIKKARYDDEPCNSCKGNDDVKCISVKPDDGNGKTTIALCSTCRNLLFIKLEIERSGTRN